MFDERFIFSFFFYDEDVIKQYFNIIIDRNALGLRKFNSQPITKCKRKTMKKCFNITKLP